MASRMKTRSKAKVGETSDENPGRHNRSTSKGAETSEENPGRHYRSTSIGDDASSVTTSRRSRKSTWSTAQASELRLKTAERVATAEDQLDIVMRSLKIAEMELKAHQEEIENCQQDLVLLEVGCDAHKILLENLKGLEKEEKEFRKAVHLLELDETLATNQLDRLKNLSSLANQHANNMDTFEDSDDSQDLSGEEDADISIEDCRSRASDGSEDQRFRTTNKRRRASPSPPRGRKKRGGVVFVTSDKLHAASDKLHMASDKSSVASDKSHVASDKLHAASDKLHMASDKSSVASDKSHVASEKLHAASDKSSVASDKSSVASDKSHVASDKLHVASDKLPWTFHKSHVSPDELHVNNAVQQLATVLSKALGKATSSGSDPTRKMLARQAMKTELSPFDGTSSEWPVFKQQYHTVSLACGLSDVENLQRLQRSLRGEARESVRALLMSPDNVKKIMSVLEKRFGNAEHIIEDMVNQVRKMPVVREGDYSGLLKLVDTVRNLAETAVTMDCQPYLTNPQLIKSIVDKLPAQFQVEWAKERGFLGKVYPDLQDVAAWLESVGDYIGLLHRPQSAVENSTKRSAPARPSKPQKSYAAAEPNAQRKKCRACDGADHHPSKCKVFENMTVEQRWKWVRKQRFCFACLNYGHSVTDCRSKRECRIHGCDKYHHNLLHSPLRNSSTIVRTETVGHTVVSGHINLNILPVQLSGPKGTINTYAMLDPGATLSVVDAQVAKNLGLRGPLKPLTHSGLHSATTVNNSRIVSLQVKGEDEPARTGSVFQLKNVRTVPHLSLPHQSVRRATVQKWKHLKKIPVALYEDGCPTILIGQDNAHLCNTSQLVLGPANAPAAGKTELGWVLMGRVGAVSNEHKVSYHLREETEDNLHQLVKHHFSTEAFGVKPNVEKPRSKEDSRAMSIMNDTLKRVGAHWECGLLWKTDDPKLPTNSRETALKRLLSMERKMDADPEFAKTYMEKMGYYIEKGYARKLTSEEARDTSGKCYYLSHFLASNPKKLNKKRFVLDAASKTSGKSLNDFLLAGPDQLKPLPSVLFKFREKAIGITADVKDMFHRVGVAKEDVNAQRFLWRGMDREKEPYTYVIDVLFFGASCSPAIAQEAKNRNARESTTNPEMVDKVVNNFFVDDLMDSADSVEEALKIQREMQSVMEKGNFQLCGWSSNSTEFLEQVPVNIRAERAKNLELCDKSATERVLGHFWNPYADVFTFSLKYVKIHEDLISRERFPTKRELLAMVMSIYDPLGFLSLLTVRAKMLLQDTWRSKIGWDDEIPKVGHEKWAKWLAGVQKIPEFKSRRCYSNYFSTAEVVTLHVFVDASEQAYGAVAYFTTDGPTEKEVSLVGSKARVAPLKPLSIPRMELQAAVLGARYAKFIRDEHRVPVSQTVYWSDSRTVLSWLEGDGRKFQQFVAHRIGELQELTNPQEWRWIPTKLNVADELTRDVEECDFSTESRWVRGPEFLRENEPKINSKFVESTAEMKKEFCGAITNQNQISIIEVERFSSWTRLIRTTARVMQFIQKLKREESRGFIGIKELLAAEEFWWIKVQDDSFRKEKGCVAAKGALPRNSRVSHLTLFLDENNVMRVDGRLRNANVPETVKFPVVLDPKHAYTKLLIRHYHEAGGHHGQDRVVNELRQKFTIPNLRAAVRSSWNSCQQCMNNRALPRPPLMGQLPSQRLESGVYPFTNSGVDYFGPLEVTIGRRHEKRWGVLFTCLSTRAVHLEIAASMSTDSCILAIRRFVGRRGCPKKLFSDNGTNFHGANNELQRALMELDQQKLTDECTAKKIDWHFNPPSAPHMGGSWERLVRSVKVALKATLKERSPREEVLQTLFVEAEHSVNSHPLTHVPVDPEDPEALTPNHFLIGRSSNVAPPGVFGADDMSTRKIWRVSQQLANCFWKRWVQEYLPTLQRRTKWLTRTSTVEVGDVVLEVDPQQQRNKWTKGIITATYPGQDGIVRVVDMKTSGGTYRRPVAKLAILDVRREGESAPKKTNDTAASLVSGRMSPNKVIE